VGDVGVLVGEVRRFSRVRFQVEQLGLAREGRQLQQFPLALADRAAEQLDVDENVVVG
jgi:hypothetical protein